MPHFRVEDNLHSHPKAQRAGDEAMGMWARAGSFCMAYLTDGFIPDWWVRQQPKGTAKARKLVAAGLWSPDAQRDGETGYQFHEFVGIGRQDSSDKIAADRKKWRRKKADERRRQTPMSPGDTPGDSPGDTESARPENAPKNHGTKGNTKAKTGAVQSTVHTPTPTQNEHRKPTNQNVTTCADDEMSPGDTLGESPGESLRVTRDTNTNTNKENSGHQSLAATEPNGRDAIAATPGAELVRQIIPAEHPDAVRTMLRVRASELIRSGTPRPVVAAALELWLTKPALGANALPALVSEAIKIRDTRSRTPPTGGGVTPGEAKVLGWANLGNRSPEQRKALGQ